jgi:hypothetical protein
LGGSESFAKLLQNAETAVSLDVTTGRNFFGSVEYNFTATPHHEHDFSGSNCKRE